MALQRHGSECQCLPQRPVHLAPRVGRGPGFELSSQLGMRLEISRPRMGGVGNGVECGAINARGDGVERQPDVVGIGRLEHAAG